MDFKILYAIQNIRTPFTDNLWLFITNLAGANGELWLILGCILILIKRTRKCGITLLISYVFVYFFGNLILKDLIARPRPCHIDETIRLLVSRPSSFSCPSTHSGWAFAACTSVFMHNKKAGLAVLILSAMVAFSRMYLFVHFPSDVLFGAILGVISGFAAAKIVQEA